MAQRPHPSGVIFHWRNTPVGDDKPGPPANGKAAEASKPPPAAVKLEIKPIGEGVSRELPAKK